MTMLNKFWESRSSNFLGEFPVEHFNIFVLNQWKKNYKNEIMNKDIYNQSIMMKHNKKSVNIVL